VYAAAVWFVLRRPCGPRALLVVIGVAVLARLIALPSPPTLSTDVFRYVWDGRIQAAGVNPYLYVPASEQLALLRDSAIFPNVDKSEYARTIYPPVAEMIFWLVSRASETLTAMKIAMLAFDMLTIATIVALLRQDGLPAERVLVYAWHPLPIWEFAGTGHVDAAAIAFMCLAMLAASRKRGGMAGALLAAGSLVKPFPLAIAPALWRRWDWRMPTAFIVVAAAAYLPYLGAGRRVFGFLGGYADEELYLDGKGFFFVAALRTLGLPAPSGTVFALLAFAILAALAAAVSFRARSVEVERAGPILLGTFFLVLTSPHFAWYFAWVIPLLCRMFYIPLAYLTLASVLLYYAELHDTGETGETLWPVWSLYLGFAALVAIDLILRRKLPTRKTA